MVEELSELLLKNPHGNLILWIITQSFTFLTQSSVNCLEVEWNKCEKYNKTQKFIPDDANIHGNINQTCI